MCQCQGQRNEVRRLQKENDRLLLKLAATQHIDYEVEG